VNKGGLKGKNCFDEVRFILAFMVLIVHTSELASVDELEWFTRYFDSDFAVKGFFAISGYLVTKSYFSSKSLVEYFEKRIRRIYPAYIVVVIYCFVVGAIASSIKFGDFLFDAGSFKYLLANLAFLNFLQPTLPEVFTNNNIQVVNGSLWTIKVELMLYFVIPVLCTLYARAGKVQGYLVALFFGAAWFVYFYSYFPGSMGVVLARQFPGQLPFFALGSVLSFFSFSSKNRKWIILISIVYYFSVKPYLGIAVSELINMIVYPLFVISISSSTALSLGVGRFGDLSYGIYLFHFPTIQLLQHFGLYQVNPYLGFLSSIALVLALAYASWHLIEKHWLKRSSHYIKTSV
jgi:peptidoglycan/LPS O-acetylase OafA/YrhL